MQTLQADQLVHRKQRPRAKRIYQRLKQEHGYTGDYTVVKDVVREHERHHREVFVPLVHPPGHAQVDFGEAVVIVAGVEPKGCFFAIDLPHSDAPFVEIFPRATTETFCQGHVDAFAQFGGVPHPILYDNTTIAVGRITGDGVLQRTQVFSQLVSA